MTTFSKIGFSGLRGNFPITTPLYQRYFFTSSSALKPSAKQQATISPKLKETLLSQMRENTKQEKPNPLGCNCLPLKGTMEFQRMAEQFIKGVKEYKGNHQG